MRIVITETGQDSGFTVDQDDEGYSVMDTSNDVCVAGQMNKTQLDEWLSNAGMHLEYDLSAASDQFGKLL